MSLSDIERVSLRLDSTTLANSCRDRGFSVPKDDDTYIYTYNDRQVRGVIIGLPDTEAELFYAVSHRSFKNTNRHVQMLATIVDAYDT